jgi:hypothetical protein
MTSGVVALATMSSKPRHRQTQNNMVAQATTPKYLREIKKPVTHATRRRLG